MSYPWLKYWVYIYIYIYIFISKKCFFEKSFRKIKDTCLILKYPFFLSVNILQRRLLLLFWGILSSICQYFWYETHCYHYSEVSFLLICLYFPDDIVIIILRYPFFLSVNTSQMRLLLLFWGILSSICQYFWYETHCYHYSEVSFLLICLYFPDDIVIIILRYPFFLSVNTSQMRLLLLFWGILSSICQYFWYETHCYHYSEVSFLLIYQYFSDEIVIIILRYPFFNLSIFLIWDTLLSLFWGILSSYLSILLRWDCYYYSEVSFLQSVNISDMRHTVIIILRYPFFLSVYISQMILLLLFWGILSSYLSIFLRWDCYYYSEVSFLQSVNISDMRHTVIIILRYPFFLSVYISEIRHCYHYSKVSFLLICHYLWDKALLSVNIF